MVLTPIILSCIAARQAPAPKHHHWLSRPLIALLHYRPADGSRMGRYSVRLRAKVLNGQARGYRRKSGCPFDPADGQTLRLLSKD